MKTVYSKALAVLSAAFGGLILYYISVQSWETLRWIGERHPDMGIFGWLMFGLWFASGIAVCMLSEHFWKGRTLFVSGDLPMAITMLYMLVSTLIYMIFFGF